MTERGKERGARALLQAVCSTEMHHFPKIFVIGESVFFTYEAARRMKNWLEYDQIVQFRHGWLDHHTTYEIEVMTFEEAYKITHGHEMPEDIKDTVDYSIDQRGETSTSDYL